MSPWHMGQLGVYGRFGVKNSQFYTFSIQRVKRPNVLPNNCKSISCVIVNVGYMFLFRFYFDVAQPPRHSRIYCYRFLVQCDKISFERYLKFRGFNLICRDAIIACNMRLFGCVYVRACALCTLTYICGCFIVNFRKCFEL